MRPYYKAEITEKIIGTYNQILKIPGRMGYSQSELRQIFASYLKEQGFDVVEEYSFTSQIRKDVVVEKRPDIIVNDEIVIEIKTCAGPKEQKQVRNNKHREQVKLYLILGQWPVGLCFYFGGQNFSMFRIDKEQFQKRD